jgi:hypothetical protein
MVAEHALVRELASLVAELKVVAESLRASAGVLGASQSRTAADAGRRPALERSGARGQEGVLA